MSQGFAFTPAAAKIHFTVANHTDGRVLSLLVFQSDDADFATFDTLQTVGQFSQGIISAGGPNRDFKAYQKIIIQTNRRTFDTGALAYGGRCSAFSLTLNAEGVKVSRDYSHKIMKWIRLFLVVSLLTYFIKGFPLLLIVGYRFKRFYKDFLLLNGIFALSFFIPIIVPLGVDHGEGFDRLGMFIYAMLLLVAAFETCRYTEQVPESPKRMTFAIIVSSLLWAFPGYILVLFGIFLFGGC